MVEKKPKIEFVINFLCFHITSDCVYLISKMSVNTDHQVCVQSGLEVLLAAVQGQHRENLDRIRQMKVVEDEKKKLLEEMTNRMIELCESYLELALANSSASAPREVC